TNSKSVKLSGYKTYTAPSIPRAIPHKKGTNREETVILAQVAILVDVHVPHAQRESTDLCNEAREVVVLQIKHNKTTLTVASTYIRPAVRRGEDMSWLAQTKPRHKKEAIIIGGDFNAPHKEWGYNRSHSRGKALKSKSKELGFVLINEPGTPTRIGRHAKQADTTPDLTWATKSVKANWRTMQDAMGSDHLPIIIELPTKDRYKRDAPFIRWDKLHEIIQTATSSLPLDQQIQLAIKAATKTCKVKEVNPNPDLDLLNLWSARLQAQQRYRKAKQNNRFKIKLNIATSKAKYYTKKLKRQIWRRQCNSFNEKTGLRRMWRTYKGMSGKKRNKCTGKNLAIRLGITEEELAALNLITRTTGKTWGAQDQALKNMVKALLVPKATYGINYINLTKAQKNGLEALNREALRVITGLPKCTKIETLYQIAGFNTIEEIAKENKTGQVLRLQKTTPGREILKDLGIQGNEEAHAAAREQLQASLPGRGSTRPVDRKGTIEETDPAELKAREREERRRRLNEQLQQDEHPLPSTSYSRWERVCLRRLRTGTAMTPARINKFKRKDNEDPQAGLCEECLPVRPSCLQEWILPVGCPEHRKAILDSLIDYINAHQLEARGTKARAAEPRFLGSIPTPARFDLDEHRTGVRSCITTA
ncbi:hypothetical protein HPB47_000189, partial [Ixodes persulcatus]